MTATCCSLERATQKGNLAGENRRSQDGPGEIWIIDATVYCRTEGVPSTGIILSLKNI
jgi:hypothetical protein